MQGTLRLEHRSDFPTQGCGDRAQISLSFWPRLATRMSGQTRDAPNVLTGFGSGQPDKIFPTSVPGCPQTVAGIGILRGPYANGRKGASVERNHSAMIITGVCSQSMR